MGLMPYPPHVLVICYDFPGIYAAGVIRTYQLAKSLADFGWQPVILTAQPCSLNQEDNIEISDGELQCPKITEAASRFLVPFQIDHHAPRKPPDGVVPEAYARLRRLIRSATQLAIPDGKIGWWHPAVKRSLRLARDYPIRMCFSVSPRPTSHLVAYRVARCLNIPWVADFALPWSDAYWLKARPRFIGWLDQQLEGLAVRAAQHVTVAYADIARSICARHGNAWGEKISVVSTGFAEDLFNQQCPPLSSKFTVVYPGNHFCEQGRYGECFLKAVDEWTVLEPRLAEKVEFVFIGKRDDELLRQRAAMVHPQVIRVEPLISHRACIQAILSSHLCVVNTVGNRIPAKVYECMRAGKWILALTDPGTDLADMMRHYSRGLAIAPREISAIRHALQELVLGNYASTSDPIKAEGPLLHYTSKHSSEVLARIFEDLSRSRRPLESPRN
jgi:hypothetical protein